MNIVKRNAYDVVPCYGAKSIRNAKYAPVYGFEWGDIWYWFNRKKDAEKAGAWVVLNDWDSMGDLESKLRSALIEIKGHINF